jgi:uncharacterized protein (DUF362 family)
MKKFNRREFLKATALGLGSLALDSFLTACGRAGLETEAVTRGVLALTPTGTKRPGVQETSRLVSESPMPAQAGVTASPANIAGNDFPDLAVARGDGMTQVQPEELVRRAIKALGGMDKFVPAGAKVIIKPNICVAYHTYEYAATTNPWVVAALVKLCLEVGASKVTVMDNPFGGTAEDAYERSGIADQVRQAGGEMVEMAFLKYVPTEIAQGLDLKRCEIYDDVLKADVFIDVPIAKHHSLARLTLGMKNLMGVIQNRQAIHRNIGQRLADLTSQIYPTLIIVDAVRILMDHGPTGGSLDDVKIMDTVIASRDIVAADSCAAGLFGMAPEDLDYIQAGTKMGLGRSDLKNLRIEEIKVGA